MCVQLPDSLAQVSFELQTHHTSARIDFVREVVRYLTDAPWPGPSGAPVPRTLSLATRNYLDIHRAWLQNQTRLQRYISDSTIQIGNGSFGVALLEDTRTILFFEWKKYFRSCSQSSKPNRALSKYLEDLRDDLRFLDKWVMKKKRISDGKILWSSRKDFPHPSHPIRFEHDQRVQETGRPYIFEEELSGASGTALYLSLRVPQPAAQDEIHVLSFPWPCVQKKANSRPLIDVHQLFRPLRPQPAYARSSEAFLSKV